MAGEFKLTVAGASELVTQLAALAPDLRRGPARRALRKGAEPLLARAIAETPQLSHDIYRGGVLIRRKGTLRRALTIRNSKDTNRTGDVGVFVNIKPLQKTAVTTFKATTGRRGADNPDDPYYWRWVHFATKNNKNPVPFLTRAADAVLATTSLTAISTSLAQYFQRLNRKAGK